MTYEDMCELFGEVRCQGKVKAFSWRTDLKNEEVAIWYEKGRCKDKRYRAEASRWEPVPAHRRGTYVTEYGRTVWDETDMRIISAPTLKQLVRKLTEEGEYHL